MSTIGTLLAEGLNGNDAFTKLLLPFEGTNGATTTTDQSSAAHAMTFNGTSSISTAQSKFGVSSCSFGGTGSTDFLSTPDSADWDYGAGDFTIDFWVRYNDVSGDAVAGYALINQRDGAATDFAFSLDHLSGNYRFNYTTNGAGGSIQRVTFANVNATGSWDHVAFVRNGASTFGFFNGVSQTLTGSVSGTIWNSAQVLRIGGDASNAGGMNGWIDGLRISKGIARWTSNFAVPVRAYGP